MSASTDSPQALLQCKFSSLVCRVPQGSVPGPVLFSLHTLPLGHLSNGFNGISYNSYTDDTQLYFSVKPSNLDSVSWLNKCFFAITECIYSNFLHLSSSKTEVLVLGPDSFSKEVSHCFAPLPITWNHMLKTLESSLTNFYSHTSELIQSFFLHLRNIEKIAPLLSFNHLEAVVHTFLSPWSFLIEISVEAGEGMPSPASTDISEFMLHNSY